MQTTLITNTNSKKIATILDDISGIKFINNIVNSNVEVNVNLFRKEIIDWALLRSLPMPSSNNSNLISNYTDDKSPKQDIVALQKNPFVIGAFNLGNKKIPIPLLMKTGTSWKPDIIEPVKVIKPKIIVCKTRVQVQ